MKYTQVKNCRYSNQEETKIDCEVLFEKLGWVEFTSSLNDLPHSIEIYQRAQSGEFGEVAQYIPLASTTVEVPLETKIRDKRNLLLSNLDLIICNPLRWSSISSEQQADYARYRQELLDVPQQPGFPADVSWPVPPANLVEPKEAKLSIIL